MNDTANDKPATARQRVDPQNWTMQPIDAMRAGISHLFVAYAPPRPPPPGLLMLLHPQAHKSCWERIHPVATAYVRDTGNPVWCVLDDFGWMWFVVERPPDDFYCNSRAVERTFKRGNRVMHELESAS